MVTGRPFPGSIETGGVKKFLSFAKHAPSVRRKFPLFNTDY